MAKYITCQTNSNIKYLVDDDMYEVLIKYKWYDNHGYARTAINGKFKFMHHFIIPKVTGMDTDHIDRNTRNNTRSNLRTVTHAENMRNIGIRKHNTSGYTGISWHKRNNKYQARVAINKIRYNLGFFNTVKEASQAVITANNNYDKFGILPVVNELPCNNKTGYACVSFHKIHKKYRTYIYHKGKTIHINGLFNTPEEAYKARLAKLKELGLA